MRRPGGPRNRDSPRAASRWQHWHLDRHFPLFIAVIAYGPLLLTHRGMVGADTKQYLYLDPGRLLSQATTMWDPNTGMGTVTHQNIGYLWPMGPWYRLFAAAGVPVWVAQRLWTGTLLLAAALGVRWLLRTLGWEGPGVAVAGLAYMLSPYVVQYEARISAILMPWAALPWLLALAIRALRRGGWRDPAVFALVAASVGSVNATGLIYAGLAPVLWFPYAVWGLGVATARRAAVAMVKIGGLTLVLSLWWIAGIVVEGRYGLNILRYTETVEVVARTGVPFEALRGLGNWFFYGRDAVGPWVQPAQDYTNWPWLLAVSFTVPAVAFAAAFVVRWRYKLYFAGLILVGVALAVGVHPYAHPSPLGSLFKAFATGSTLGLALRSTGRAVPLVALGSAVMLGAGIDAVWRGRDAVDAEEPLRRGWSGLTPVAFGLVTVLLLADMAPLWLGQFVDNNLQRPETLPSYWPAAAAFLAGQGRSSAGGYDTRVLELPGADFSHYRWGATLDPVTPGLMDRPFVGRQLQPSGSPASADLLRALDRQLQEGVLDPAAIAPVARLMGAGDVLLRSDLQYERFHTPRASATWQQFSPAPAGLQAAGTFGPPVADHPVIPFTDEVTLANLGSPLPPAVAVFGVQDPVPIIRAEPAAAPMVLAGDGEGVVDVATAGLLGGAGGGAGQAVLYAANLEQDPSALATAVDSGADLVLTDTNRRRAQRWGTVRDVNGYTEQAGETPMVTDTNDARLPLFPGAGDTAYTVSQQRGGAAVQATHYGNTVSYSPADRPDLAMDGNLNTSWKVGATAEAIGERLGITMKSPVTTGEVTLVQPLTPATTPTPGTAPGSPYQLPPQQTRVITQVTLTFDGGHPLTTTLGSASLLPEGQKVVFPVRTFHRLEIRIDDTSTHRADHRHDNGVGFAEVRIGPPPQAPTINEVIRLPTDLLSDVGNSANQHRLWVVLTRARSNPAEPFKPDEESSLARTFTLPTARSFALGGTARVSALASDQQVDRLLGRPDPPIANSSGRLPGDLAARSSSALDGDPATWWSPGRGPQEGNWISADLPHPVSLDHWTMQVVADGLHSVPTRLSVQIDDQPERLISLPPVADASRPGATVAVPIDLGGPVTAQSRVTVSIDGVRPINTLDSLSGLPITLPVGIAELGLPGLTVPPAAPAVPAGCRTDLLSIDGQPVGLRIMGTTAAAAQRTGLQVEACGPGLDATGAITLGPGPHEVRTQPGQVTGIDLDQLVFGSNRGGGPLSVAASTGAPAAPGAGVAPSAPAPAAPGAPAVKLLTQGRTSARLRIDASPAADPFWLVLGQSLNAGWQARITGPGGRSLGPPRLIDGYANGWLVHPPPGRSIDVTLEWTPQRPVNVALWVSLLGALLCVGLAAAPSHFRGFRAPSTLRSARLPERPSAHRPWRIYEPQLSRQRTVTLVLGIGAVASLLIGWVPGLVVAAFIALACRQGRWHALLGVAAAAGVVASGVYVTGAELSHHYKLVLEWPVHFEAASGVAWVAVALVTADAVIGHVRGRRLRRSSTDRADRAEDPPS